MGSVVNDDNLLIPLAGLLVLLMISYSQQATFPSLRQFVWLGIAVLMLTPILMVFLTLVLPQPASRWASIIVAAFFFLFNLFASVQDVVTDALAVRLLDERQRGLANGVQVGAYRIGMVLGGGLLLYVYARFGWRPMFLSMSMLLLLCSLPAFWLRVPAARAELVRHSVAAVRWRATLSWHR